MYASAFVLGFHGCEKTLGEAVLAGKKQLTSSTNSHDWLGHGIYFWENSPARALHWAEFIHRNPTWFGAKVKTPFVIGAIIDLGHCLDLTEASSLSSVREAHNSFSTLCSRAGLTLPSNEKGSHQDEDLVKRHLDCAVINHLHSIRETEGLPNYDSVRGAFFEGKPLYPGAGIMEKTHIQICIRSSKQIRGYFRPLDL